MNAIYLDIAFIKLFILINMYSVNAFCPGVFLASRLNLKRIDHQFFHRTLAKATQSDLIDSIGEPITKFKVERKTNLFEKGAIFLLSFLLAFVAPNRKECMENVRLGMDFDGFVKVTKKMLQGTDAITLRTIIVNLLKKLMPEKVRLFFQETYQTNPQYLCESSSQWMTFGFLDWLIGPTHRFHVNITQTNDTQVQWESGVKLQECRYLVESGCKATCLHLCKGPTQQFFNDELGVPMTMKPNFEDCSCEMIFGTSPPPPEEDPIYAQPCFSSCSMARLETKRRWRQQGFTQEESGRETSRKCS
mmetsp:Transcript_28460/g.28790  ORF Transcript_28460/g.28790 Transcript_28460/m.28790 type:complete len:304 (+) Transcript_28460:165-1076(+)